MAHIWPIGGGKGGTGKSFITGNMGILLARQRFKTLLIDADLGAANLHTIVGQPYPDISLSDFINKKVPTLSETVLETQIPNLFLISGARNRLDIANLPYEQKTKMLRAISRLDYQYILLDLSSGTSFNTIDFFTLSDSGIFVCCPELTSIENLYGLIRSVYLRKIRQVLKVHHFRKLAEKAEERNPDAVVNRPECLLDTLKEIDSENGRMIETILQGFQLKLVLNQVRKQDNPEMGSLICKIVEKHLGLKIQFIGNVAYDERVHDELRKKGPFVDKYPYCRTAMDLKALSRGIAGIAPKEIQPLRPPDITRTQLGLSS
jgi:flagellar biosynthesis protein FlhG